VLLPTARRRGAGGRPERKRAAPRGPPWRSGGGRPRPATATHKAQTGVSIEMNAHCRRCALQLVWLSCEPNPGALSRSCKERCIGVVGVVVVSTVTPETAATATQVALRTCRRRLVALASPLSATARSRRSLRPRRWPSAAATSCEARSSSALRLRPSASRPRALASLLFREDSRRPTAARRLAASLPAEAASARAT